MEHGQDTTDNGAPDSPIKSVEIRMLEFFSGIGGMRISTEAAMDGFNRNENKQLYTLTFCQAYDISLNANCCYEHNFHSLISDYHSKSVSGGVSTKLVEHLKPSDVDNLRSNLWTMSPPCQPFTSNGAQDSKNYLDNDDKRCNGLKGLMRLLSSIERKPQWILLENVKGFGTSDMANEWCTCLRENGYTWKSYLLSPIQYGVPNHRRRFYILAERSLRWSKNTFLQTPCTKPPSHSVDIGKMHVGDYLFDSTVDELHHLLVPASVLEKNFAKNLGLVTAADTATHCFTAGYGRIYHRSTGSLLLMESWNSEGTTPLPAVANQSLDRSNMLAYSGHLRRFAPRELLRLFGFPKEYEFPSDIPLEHQYKLIGNSISVFVVTELIMELLDNSSEMNFSQQQHFSAITYGDAINWDKLVIGGIKGHIEEKITGNLLNLYRHFRWKMIPNCTGRHTCRDHEIVSTLSPVKLLEKAELDPPGKIWQEYAFDLPDRPDRVLVVPMDIDKTMGLITFAKNHGQSYVHTLNTPSGFRRKLEAIGIAVSSGDIWVP
jgi:tRNA (cytosine38-C5)-methyltransferase